MSETGMPVLRLMKLVDNDDELKVQVRWKGLTESEDTLEPALKVYEEVPQFFMKLLARRNTFVEMVVKSRLILHL